MTFLHYEKNRSAIWTTVQKFWVMGYGVSTLLSNISYMQEQQFIHQSFPIDLDP